MQLVSQVQTERLVCQVTVGQQGSLVSQVLRVNGVLWVRQVLPEDLATRGQQDSLATQANKDQWVKLVLRVSRALQGHEVGQGKQVTVDLQVKQVLLDKQDLKVNKDLLEHQVLLGKLEH